MDASRTSEARLQSLGRWLKEAREAQGLSLAEAEAATRIRRKFLEALEAGRWTDLPNEIVGRGFLRNYASLLGLDPEEALARSSGTEPDAAPAHAQPPAPAESGEVAQEPTEDRPVPPSQPIETRPQETGEEGRARDYGLLQESLFEPRHFPWLRVIGWVLVVVVLAAIGFASWAYWNNPQLLANLGLPQLQATATVTEQPIARVTRITATPSDTPTATPLPSATPTLRSTRTPTPSATVTPTIRPAPSDGLELFVRTVDRCWVDVYADDANIFTELLEPAVSEAFQAQRQIRLTIGDAGALEVTVNGQRLGMLGDRGEIIFVSWTLAGDSIEQTFFTPTPLPGETVETSATSQPEQPAATEPSATGVVPAETATAEAAATPEG